jgi:molybdenum cofactor synthesis domain-containing protein
MTNPEDTAKSKVVTAALAIIGNEVLSGRTRDANLQYLGENLNALGIRMLEVRVIPDVEATIIATVNDLRTRFDYVFTTGGIGPTHDDITALAVARAFGVALVRDPEAERRVRSNYASPADITPARLKMAEVPEGSELLDNPVSRAPGFRVENVYVLPGVPRIMQAMFEGFRHKLVGGVSMKSREIAAYLPEGRMGGPLGEIQARFPETEIGSYPFVREGRFGAALVVRHADQAMVDAASEAVRAMIRELGEEPIEG